MVKLGYIGKFQAGFGFPERFQGKVNGDFPFAKVGDISKVARAGNKYIETANHFVDQEDLPLLKAKTVPKGTIVFAKIGEAISQNFRAISSKEMLIDNNAMGLVPNLEIIDLDYLYHFMCKLDLYKYAGITTVPALRKSTLEEIDIPLPPLAEQKRIAAILDKADAIRRKRQQAIQLADDFLRAVFLEMFGDPVTNPKGWEVRSFSDVCKCSQGIQVDSELQKDSAENGYVKFLRIINYTQSSKEFKFIPAPSTDKALINKDEIVMVRYGATAGFVGRGLDGVLANNLFKISFEKSVLENEYFYYLLNSDYFQNILRNNKKGGAMPAISFGQLNDIEIMTPSLEVQSKFSQVVNMISDIKEHSIHSALLSNDSFNALSQKAFAGEL
ncbi:type I restriction enzyme, S subunit [Shewanella morhuae]|nr:type I restriction enzyme, S subunit [Shewanella morhuae]